MPLPENTWEHLQSTFIRTQNRIVREEFPDVLDDDGIASSRASLKVACTHQDTDNALITELRLWMFYIVLRKAQDLHPAIYGLPTTSYQENFRFKPQIQLYFLEDLDDVEAGYARVDGTISVRLMNQTEGNLSESELRQFGQRIKSGFGTANGFIWKKGKTQASYTDRKKGYALKIHCRSEGEGRRVIEQILDIQSDTPDWQYLNISENASAASAYPTIPPTDFILGKTRRQPRKRPVADVRFQYAVAHLYSLPNPVVLYDRVYKFRSALVER